jgi:hypothetical protein
LPSSDAFPQAKIRRPLGWKTLYNADELTFRPKGRTS